MRAYFFGNMYLSSIQQGIQAAHCLAEIYETTRMDQDKTLMVKDWATNHKTMILLNAGYSEEIRSIYQFLFYKDNPYPFARFRESTEALDNALTCAGIILPEKIYVPSALFQKRKLSHEEEHAKTCLIKFKTYTFSETEMSEYTQFEIELMERLAQYRLAS